MTKLPAEMALTVTAPTGKASKSAGRSTPRRVTVRSYDQATVAKLGGLGLAFTVADPDTATTEKASATTTVGIRAAIGGFSKSYGADLATRLRLRALPGCALTTPKVTACQIPTTVPSHVDLTTQTLVADVPVASAPAAAASADTSTALASAATIFALAADTSGEGGSFSASSIGVSSTWSVGSQSGDFSWSYPIPELDPVAGDTPGLRLAYSSQSVDGLVASKNTQPTWAGLGWDLSVPYLERSYTSCPPAPITELPRGDQCWAGDVLSLSMAGRSSPLVKDPAAGADVWRPRDDPGWSVQRFRNAPGNGDNDGEYWVVTTSDGTKYTMGRGRQPVTGTPTNSVFTVPVFGLKTGEPCRRPADADSWCQQAWRWNVDSIVDSHGNAQTYFYTQEKNSYQRWATTPTEYVRGGHLADITYGQRDGAQNVAAPLRLHLTAAPRCIGAADGTGTCPALTDANASAYPDVPTILLCAQSATSCNQVSPSFFSGDLLRSVTAQRANGTAWTDVDRVSFSYSFPAPTDGSSASLWLEKITRTGLGGGVTTTLPDVTFTGKEFDNRIDANPAGGVPLLRKLRIASATDELGRQVEVTYGQPDPCGPTNFPEGNADENVQNCFPARRANGDSPAAFGWYYKYLATQTVVRDTSGGAPPQVTRYDYRGTPAWHQDENLVDPDVPQSWGDWRGYGEVDILSMTDPASRGETTSRAISLTRTRFFRGMDGDALSGPGNPTKSVQVPDSLGGSTPDVAWLNGRIREERQFQVDTAGNPTFELGGKISDYASARTIAAGTGAPDPQKDAHLVVPTKTTARQTVINESTGARTSRTTTIATTYDSFGQSLTVTNTGNVASDVRCTRMTYARDTATIAAGMLSFPYRTRSYTGSCTTPSALVSSQEAYFDGSATLGAPITRGDPTRAVMAVTASGPDTPATTVATSSTFDVYGRTLTATDAKGNISRTAYTPATGLPTTTTATNALGQTSSLTMEADRRLPVQSRDANGQLTTSTYDGLGRVLTIRTPDQAASAPPAMTFAYTLDPARTKPARITSRQLQSGSTYLTSYQFMDSLARPRQQQAESPASTSAAPKTVLTDTRYDDRGQVAAQTVPLVSAGTPGTALIAVNPASSDETRTTYDTAGRAVRGALFVGGTLKYQTTTAYFGDHARSTPPPGGAAKTTWTDEWNRTIRSDDGTGSSLVSTTYAYDSADRVIRVTDPAQHASTTSYDLLGRVTASSDPDAGASSVTYDPNGNPLTTTDAKGAKLTADYDALDRPTALWAGASGTGTRLHSFTYDSTSISNGIGRATSESTFDAGKTYTQSVTGYDQRGRPTGTKWDFPSGLGFRLTTASFSTKYAYDTAGHLTSIQYPDNLPGAPAETISTGYDALGFAKTLTATSTGLLGTTTTPLLTNSDYAGDGKLISRSYANSLHPLTRQYSYEQGTQRLSNVSTLVGNPLTSTTDVKQDDSYSWDPSGNLTRITDNTTVSALTPNPVNTCFTYDSLERLDHAWTSKVAPACSDSSSTTTHDGPAGMNQSWTYSPDGNMTSARSLLVTKNYAYTDPKHPHAVTSNGLNSYTYDANGAMISKVTGIVPTSLSWNPEHRLDKTVSGLLTNRYVYSANGSRLVRFNADGSATLYIDGQEISIAKGITTGTRYYSIEDTLVAQRQPLGLSWQLNDVQGSAQISVTNGLSLLDRTYYDPYGNIRSGIGASNPKTDHGFLGSVKDPSTGLNALGARYYDSDLARFISVDPVSNQESAQSANAYGYGNNNPVQFSDPTGLFSFSITKAVSSAKNWVGDHKQVIASAAVGVAVGIAACATVIACGAGLTVGAAITAAAVTGAASGAASYGFDVATGAEKNPSWKGLFEATGVGAVTGVLTLGASAVLRPLLRRPAQYLASQTRSLFSGLKASLKRFNLRSGGGTSEGPKLDAPDPKPAPTGPKQEAGASSAGGGSTSGNGGAPEIPGSPTLSRSPRSFGSGKPPHVADVSVTRNGENVWQETLTSGNMTPEEAALGFPRSTLATHTENRGVRQAPLQAGDEMLFNGQYPPCPSCKGAMNKAARETGALITYRWPGGSWTAGKK